MAGHVGHSIVVVIRPERAQHGSPGQAIRESYERLRRPGSVRTKQYQALKGRHKGARGRMKLLRPYRASDFSGLNTQGVAYARASHALCPGLSSCALSGNAVKDFRSGKTGVSVKRRI